VNILCEEIGSGILSKPYVLGCEGRNLLNTLSSHEFRQTYAQRTMIRESYLQALKRYLSGEEPVIPVDTKVDGILGTINGKRAEYAERLQRILEKVIQPTFSLQEIAQEILKETLELGKKIRPFKCLSCPMVKTGESGLTSCVCCEGLTLDVCLLGFGGYDDWRIMLKVHRRFQEEYILAYVSAVNSWLEERPMANILSKCSCKYLNNEIYEKIYENVNASLGSMDPAKTWLAACLLKTIKSNQRWHDTHEVIDDFPETASWLMNKI
jgi:hypothetical protein